MHITPYDCSQMLTVKIAYLWFGHKVDLLTYVVPLVAVLPS